MDILALFSESSSSPLRQADAAGQESVSAPSVTDVDERAISGEIVLASPQLPASPGKHPLEALPTPGLSASYASADRRNGLFYNDAVKAGAALGPPAPFMRKRVGVDYPEGLEAGHWLRPGYNLSKVLTLGYAWRDVVVEGSAFSGRSEKNALPQSVNTMKLDSRAARMTYRPTPFWSFQFSKGSLNGLDQLVAGGEVRRTTLSTTYKTPVALGMWETTLAWGRNSRKARESTMGYLAESTLQFNREHALFGRMERVGNDELLRENEAIQRQPFKLNKFSFGYVHGIDANPATALDVGMLVSRYLVPSHMTPAYGNDPTAYMFFVRIRMR